jgi:hypothetical protein
MKTEVIHGLINNSVNRREFARRAMTTGIGASVAAAIGLRPGDVEAQAPTPSGDTDILNFALNLEFLEAEAFSVATTGRRLADAGVATNGIGTAGATVGGSQVAFDARLSTVMQQLAFDEQTHIRLLQQALGSLAVAKPAINLGALGSGFASVNEFLVMAHQLESVGTSAYIGAGPLISSKSILTTSTAIVGTEGQHLGVLRYLLFERGLQVPQRDPLDVPLPGATTGPNNNATNPGVLYVNNNALTPGRTPSQVMAVLYGTTTTGASSGGLFPAGLNGAINRIL